MNPVSLANAIYQDDMAAVDAALAAGADVNGVPSPDDGWPPLHLAIEHQRVAIVRRLIAAGALVNRELASSDSVGSGWTPTMHAIDVESDTAWQAKHDTGHESTELTVLLLASGAVPTTRAFDIALRYDNQKALDLLRRYVSPQS